MLPMTLSAAADSIQRSADVTVGRCAVSGRWIRRLTTRIWAISADWSSPRR